MKNTLLLCVTSVTLLFFPNLLFAQAPTLGRAANFVLFTANGAVTNTGITHVTGNVGTNVGSSTGFGNVNGGMHDHDIPSGDAATDLLLAYNQLNSAIPTFFPGGALGNGDTLNAGVYKITAVTTLSSDLYLNANGDPNAVFIFQIQAAFSTDPHSKVKLINGAQACNVFWKIEGLVSMGTKTFMKGNIIANNAAINMSSFDTLQGRAFSTTGAISVDGVLAYIPAGCGSVPLTGPAAPNLGTAACYTIFSGNGSVTNSGVTHGTGDIGTNVGLTTGYDSLLINGKIHPIPDGSTSACKSDLLLAYTYIDVLAHDIQLLYPAQFGHNLVLTPHTYLLAAATSLTDTLYLNAEGNSDAVFVIKITGALTTSVNAKVVLINGAQSKNVYWSVEGAVSINDNSIIHGTIIANNGAISLGTGDSLYGRALTTNGALSTAGVVSSISAPCSTVPVTWLWFRGNQVQKNVLLEWATSNEMNNGFFTIEKSRNGHDFEVMSTVTSTASGSAEQRYSAKDLQPFNITYYRLSQTDRDGQKKYFRTIQVRISLEQGLQVQNYVEGNNIHVQISDAVPGKATMQLFSIDGKRIFSQHINLTKELSSYEINESLVKGIYLLNVISDGKKVYNGKVVVR